MSYQSRHVYTREERTILEASFNQQSHPNIHEKERLATLLNCNIIQISNWFQNYRRKMKKEKKSTTSNISTTSMIYHQPNCPFHDKSSSYYYYHYPSSSQYMYFDPYVTYEQ